MSTLTVALPDDLDALLAERTRAAGMESKEEYLVKLVESDCAAGALDEARVVRETLGAFKRAGADLILSYFTRDVVREGF